METRRNFIKKTALGAAGLTLGGLNISAKNYAHIMGSNDRIRVGVLGFSDRFRSSLGKAFLKYADDMNFEFTPSATFGTGVATKVRPGIKVKRGRQ